MRPIQEKDHEGIIDLLANNSFHESDNRIINRREYYSNLLFRLKSKESFVKSHGKKIEGVIFYEFLKFDSELFKIRSYSINNITVSKELTAIEQIKIASELIANALDKIRTDKGVFISCKIDVRNPYVSQSLQKKGFVNVSQDVSLYKQLTTKADLISGYSITDATKDDVEQLYKLAKKTYTHTRFHTDPNIQKKDADEMQGLWIKNCYNQRLADKIIIAKDKGTVIGFNAIKIIDTPSDNIKNLRIILIGVAKEYQRKGIGIALMAACENYALENKCKGMIVGTQGINEPAIRAYQKAGFMLNNLGLSYHKWLTGP